jgi:ribosome-associated protein
LAPAVKERLLATPDQRISKDGVLVIKAQASRSLERAADTPDALVRRAVSQAMRGAP